MSGLVQNNPEMSHRKNVGVLVHGCHLQAEDWRGIVYWRDNLLGRVPTALKLAVNEEAKLIFFGTGASKDPTSGLKESEYTYSQAIGPELEQLAKTVNKTTDWVTSYLKKVVYLDTESQNTTEELKAAMKKCTELEIGVLYIVSSPSHIARCHMEACKIQEASGDYSLEINARASQSCFKDSTVSDVVIFEHPHRGDDKPFVYFNRQVRKLFGFLRIKPLALKVEIRLGEFMAKYMGKIEKYKERQLLLAELNNPLPLTPQHPLSKAEENT